MHIVTYDPRKATPNDNATDIGTTTGDNTTRILKIEIVFCFIFLFFIKNNGEQKKQRGVELAVRREQEKVPLKNKHIAQNKINTDTVSLKSSMRLEISCGTKKSEKKYTGH